MANSALSLYAIHCRAVITLASGNFWKVNTQTFLPYISPTIDYYQYEPVRIQQINSYASV